MSQKIPISLDNYFEKYVERQIADGRYKNASEVIQAGLKLLEEHQKRVAALRDAIQEGLESGVAEDFNPDDFLKELKKRNQRG